MTETGKWTFVPRAANRSIGQLGWYLHGCLESQLGFVGSDLSAQYLPYLNTSLDSSRRCCNANYDRIIQELQPERVNVSGHELWLGSEANGQQLSIHSDPFHWMNESAYQDA